MEYCRALENTATIYIRSKKPVQTEQLLTESIKIRRDLIHKFPNSLKEFQTAFHNLGTAQKNQGKFELALSTFRESEFLKRNLSQSTIEDSSIINTILAIANTLVAMKHFEKALEEYYRCKNTLDRRGVSESDEDYKEVMQSIETVKFFINKQQEKNKNLN